MLYSVCWTHISTKRKTVSYMHTPTPGTPLYKEGVIDVWAIPPENISNQVTLEDKEEAKLGLIYCADENEVEQVIKNAWPKTKLILRVNKVAPKALIKNNYCLDKRGKFKLTRRGKLKLKSLLEDKQKG